MSGISILESYSIDITFSLALCTLLYTLFLIAKIRYGGKPINKLTIGPYQFTIAYIFLFMFNNIVFQFEAA